MARAAEMFAETSTSSHEVYCLRHMNMSHSSEEKNSGKGGQWSTAKGVEVRFRGFKGDQLRKGAILTRVRKGPPRPVGVGGGAADLII